MSAQVLEQKKAVVEEIKSKIQAAQSIVLVDYKGLTVAQDTELRANFRKLGVEYKVYKNRIAKIAFNELGYADFDSALEGTTAIAFGMKDSVAPAKVVFEGMKSYNKLDAKCGLMDGAYIDKQGLSVIASLPSREVLIAKMLGSMLAPVSKLAYVLNAISEKQAQA